MTFLGRGLSVSILLLQYLHRGICICGESVSVCVLVIVSSYVCLKIEAGSYIKIVAM